MLLLKEKKWAFVFKVHITVQITLLMFLHIVVYSRIVKNKTELNQINTPTRIRN